jgi:hypothetical protein
MPARNTSKSVIVDVNRMLAQRPAPGAQSASGSVLAEGPVRDLDHVGGTIRPVRDGLPVLLGDGVDQVVVALLQPDRDREAGSVGPAGRYHTLRVEVAVRPHHHLLMQAQAPQPDQRVPSEAGRSAPGGGSALTQSEWTTSPL